LRLDPLIFVKVSAAPAMRNKTETCKRAVLARA
jgi:hypothetical protein